MLTCRQETAFLDRYLAADLKDGERGRFESHLAACPDCLAFLQTYKTTLALTKNFLASQPAAVSTATAPLKLRRRAARRR
jgi:anti-sigma factor RsiW